MPDYSKTPLSKKLGIYKYKKAFVINQPNEYSNFFEPYSLNEIEIISDLPDELAGFIHYFVTDKNTLEEEFLNLKNLLQKDGVLWISWPKGSSEIETDLNENIIREIGLRNGLVDVKVCAVDENWSGLKFIWRTKDR
jgi:hypothetical protein